MAAPTALSSTWDLVADAYLLDQVPHFEAFAEMALDIIGVDGVDIYEVADVACGPGTLALKAAARGARVAALDFSPAMISQLKGRLASSQMQAEVVVGDGQALPWADGRFHAAFSMFGLMFFPDRAAGFRELHRVLRKDGRALVSSWVPIDQVPILRDAIALLMQAAHAPSTPSAPAPLSTPETFRAEMEAAGFVDVEIEERSVLVPFASPTALLEWMSRSAPIMVMKQNMGNAAFDEVYARWNVAMMEQHGAMPLQYPLVALFGTGRRS